MIIVDLWAESEAEALDFLKLTDKKLGFTIGDIYIAKRSGGKRDVGSGYIRGEYYQLDLKKGLTSKEVSIAPKAITDMVQWCSQDIILTKDKKPLIAIETTYHLLTYNNVAQRIPRQIKSAMQQVPSVIFQKVPPANEKLNSWFAETFLRASKIFPAPALAIMFDEDGFEPALQKLCNFINETYQGNNEASVGVIKASMKEFAKSYDENGLLFLKNGKPRTWLEVADKRVTVKIGVKDNCALVGKHFGCQGDVKQQKEYRNYLSKRKVGEKGCVWLSKGTGGMDPYPGLVKLAEILLCYDQDGKKTKELVTKFTKLPADFWWFKKYPHEIYYRIIKEFSDEVEYANGFHA